MKKLLIFTFIILSIILCSCGKDNPKLEILIPKENDVYQLTTENETIDLNDYLKYSSEFNVIYNGKDYSSKDLVFSLSVGDNIFTIKTEYETVQIKIIRKSNSEEPHNHTIVILPSVDATCVKTGSKDAGTAAVCSPSSACLNGPFCQTRFNAM